VLDPFMGSGTVASVAARHGRRWLGVELNPAFVELVADRLARHEHSPPKVKT
jgi:site-specific DNA-methyltransferase (cytosine-N4-specific)